MRSSSSSSLFNFSDGSTGPLIRPIHQSGPPAVPPRGDQFHYLPQRPTFFRYASHSAQTPASGFFNPRPIVFDQGSQTSPVWRNPDRQGSPRGSSAAVRSGPVSVSRLFAVHDGRAEPVQTCGAGEDSLIKQAGQAFCHVLFRVSSAHRVYSISFSVGATLASASIRGIFVKAQVSEFSRPGGSDFFVCSVVFSS